jgi:hypothetical protein
VQHLITRLARMGCPRTARYLDTLSRRRRPPTDLERGELLELLCAEADPHADPIAHAEAWALARGACLAIRPDPFCGNVRPRRRR